MVASTSLNVVPEDPTAYKTKEYWEQRYQQESPDTTFDWFKTHEELKPLFQGCIPHKDASILILGCGNSTLGEDMYRDGYKNITNIDYSGTVIENMKKRCEDMPDMKWLEMDIRALEFENESFDIIIDKGTMDALMCDRGDVWDPSEELVAEVKKEVDEVERVLKVGGSFIYITFGQPHFRKRHLVRDCWQVKTQTLGDAFHYFFYSMQKEKPSTPSS
ncbi:S-adenosyl-L-methionine-dependent methyltransferase [Radiomyces spectabilis]|uniref:S-adenosyl-L-methionine-dependent methyltransferase n=1 Tax=Radiomyces spectabilis TaxID=64574 RepID=UPI00221EF3CC|nr:S-adenosyl-L-methionine-dependent methyltransferase [Radiomyces spectabilis]KAI8381569.1 S-adenosyl-L-methionine-dependent methyltransferase [Radiomyces spectabilis]